MAVLFLPLSFFGCLYAAYLCVHPRSLRRAFVLTFVVFLLVVFLLTEVLTLSGLLTRGALSVAWSLTTVATLFWAWKAYRDNPARESIRQTHFPASVSNGNVAWPVILLSIVLVTTAFIALLRPPNTWDSMTYHLPRVARWIQQASVAFFPTSIERQNESMPLAEFAILHAQLLSASDRFAALIQWSAYLASIVLVSLVAQTLGLRREWQILSAGMAALLPMAVFQSTSTQNDLVVSACFLAFFWAMMHLVRQSGWHWGVVAALALGLALLSKGTAYPYCAGAGMVLGMAGLIHHYKRGRLVRSLGMYLFIIAVAAAINSPHWLRNQERFGHLFGSRTVQAQLARDHSALAAAANLAKNASIHLASPNRSVNRWLEEGLGSAFAEQAGDASANFMNIPFEIRFVWNEDYAGNPLHLILIVVALMFLPLVDSRKHGLLYLCFAGVFLAVVICSFTIRWQPWASRLHLPIFMAATPLSLAVLSRWGRPGLRTARYLLAAAFLYAVPILVFNPAARLASPAHDMTLFNATRQQLYFAQRPQLYPQYRRAMAAVAELQPRAVGLMLGRDDWEYPIWALLGRHASRGLPLIAHVVDGDTARIIENTLGARPPVLVESKGYREPLGSPEFRQTFTSDYLRVHSRMAGPDSSDSD